MNNELDKFECKKCVIFGGLGNPNHSVISLYARSLSKLQGKIELICVDPIIDNNDKNFIDNRINEIKNKLNITYNQLYSPKQYFDLIKNNKENIHSVFVLTPVSTHFDILKNFASYSNIIFVVEKPSCSLDDVNNGFFDFIDTLKKNNNMFYFIDTVLVSQSLDSFIQNNYVKYLGKIKRIHAIGLDNPWYIDDQLKEFKFMNKLQAINDRGLLKSNNNGGAGLGLDMGIHAVAGLTKFLDGIGLDTNSIQIEDVHIEALDMDSLHREIGMESYLLAKCSLDDIEVIVEGGKGSDIWDRRIEIYGENEMIAIGFGSLKYKNYIIRIKNKRLLELTVFDTIDAGYNNHVSDISKLLSSKPTNLLLTPNKSYEYMKKSMEFINNIYKTVDSNVENREPFIKKIKCGPHKNMFLDDYQVYIRELLQEIAIDELI